MNAESAESAENAENAESAETRRIMTARFNHTIIASKIPADMAVFYIDILEAAPRRVVGDLHQCHDR